MWGLERGGGRMRTGEWGWDHVDTSVRQLFFWRSMDNYFFGSLFSDLFTENFEFFSCWLSVNFDFFC